MKPKKSVKKKSAKKPTPTKANKTVKKTKVAKNKVKKAVAVKKKSTVLPKKTVGRKKPLKKPAKKGTLPKSKKAVKPVKKPVLKSKPAHVRKRTVQKPVFSTQNSPFENTDTSVIDKGFETEITELPTIEEIVADVDNEIGERNDDEGELDIDITLI